MTGEPDAVVRAARDYFEGWFDGDVDRMDRALHPDLVKRSPVSWPRVMGKQRMLELTAAGEGMGHTEDERQLEITVENLHDGIASVTVRCAVYHEYIHLLRTADGWKIVNALWERP